ncbi:MAG TPA: hypothetical protein VJG90_07185 [Candidatus Nanoarchaeia archaeon]|nr:hypothetical protein [Candidatus Nanoarchaeia archaeon]
MGVLTISLKDEDEAKLRKLAKEKYGKMKGAIAKTIAEAVERNLSKNEEEKLRKHALEILEKMPRHLGKKLYKTRDDLYDRDLPRH